MKTMRKTNFLLGTFLIFYSCAQFDQKPSKGVIKTNRLPAQENKKNLGINPQHIGSDIGRVQYSMLEKEQFKFINGNGWVLMDGRCVHTNCGASKISDYYKLTKKENIPGVKRKFTPETVYSFSVDGSSGKKVSHL